MLSFWEDKKPSKYERPKRNEIKGKKANIRITDSKKEIGRTTVVKKNHDKSGYWTETDKGKVGLKRENFRSKDESDSETDLNDEIDTLRDTIDEQNQKRSHMVTRLNTQDEEFQKYKTNTQEILNLITGALKIKAQKIEDVEEQIKDSVEDDIEDENKTNSSEIIIEKQEKTGATNSVVTKPVVTNVTNPVVTKPVVTKPVVTKPVVT